MSAWTWDRLATADRAALDELMRGGATPDIRQLLGHTYRGLNTGLLPRVTGEKFKKVFYEEEGRPFGHNLLLRQDRQRPGGDWELKTKDGEPVRIGWFSLRPEGRMVRFDYNVKQNSGLNLFLRGIQDFVVLPNPGDHTLMLGRAHLLRLRVAFFLLQRETV
jgi:hypothetical protein